MRGHSSQVTFLDGDRSMLLEDGYDIPKENINKLLILLVRGKNIIEKYYCVMLC